MVLILIVAAVALFAFAAGFVAGVAYGVEREQEAVEQRVRRFERAGRRPM